MCHTVITEHDLGIILFTIEPRPADGKRGVMEGALCGNDCLMAFALKEPAPW